MESPEAYKPEDVIVQEGTNQGNINDVELARVGAIAEDYKLNRINARPLSSEIKRVISNAVYDGEYKTMEAYKSSTGDKAGEEALEYEIGSRTNVSAKAAGAQAHDAEKIARDAQFDFSNSQRSLAAKRLREALKTTSAVDADKLVQQENSKVKETWEAIREKNRLADGTYTPVIATTYDKEWMNAHPDMEASDNYTGYNMDAPSEANSLVGTFDLANTEFEDLPKFWRGEGSDIFRNNS